MTSGSLHAFLDHPRPLAIAHRGGGLEAEENMLPAFERAVALGYTHVELDVHATRDGVVVVHHDDTLERMTGDPRRLAGLTSNELRTVRTAAGAYVPTLDELLHAFPDLRLIVEIKADDAVEPLAETIRRHDALSRVCVASSKPDRTAKVRALLDGKTCWSPAHAGVARLWLAGWGLPVTAGSFPVIQVPTHFHGLPVVTPRLLRAAHARGIQVQAWTINDEAEMERLLDLGIDAIISDRPSLLRQVMERRGEWQV